MSVRIRSDKTIVCAAKSEERISDCYIDDDLHYQLSVILRVMSVCGLDKNGAELWEFHSPISLDERIKKEESIFNGNIS